VGQGTQPERNGKDAYLPAGAGLNEYAALEQRTASARKAFDALGTQRLPTIKALQAEHASLATDKKRLYRDYRRAWDDMRSLQRAKQNTDQLLRGIPAQNEQDRQL